LERRWEKKPEQKVETVSWVPLSAFTVIHWEAGTENFSEYPLLAGRLASQVIQGLQHQNVAATIKHFFANEQQTQGTPVNETISERALREIYLRPFEIAIKEANPWAVMAAYNSVNVTHRDSHGLINKSLRGI
jgi:beta-glucosidase